MNKKLLTLIGLLGAGSVFAAGPFLTIGDELRISLMLDVAARYDDNVYLRNSENVLGEVSDYVFTIAPGVFAKYGTDMSRTNFTFSLVESFYRYADEGDALNANLMGLSLAVNHRAEVYKLWASVGFNQYSVSSPIYGNVDVEGMKVERNVTSAGVGGEYTMSAKTRFGLGFRYSETHYRTNGFTDATDCSIPANFYYSLSPKVDISLGIQYRHTWSNHIAGYLGESYKFDDIFYNVGVRGELTPKLSGGINLGVTTRYVQESPTANDGDRALFGVSANLAYAMTPKTQLMLNVSNDFGSRSWDGGSQQSLSARLGMQSDLTVQWRIHAGVGYYFTNYMNGGANRNSTSGARKDHYIDASFSVIYLFNETVSASAAYMLRDNSSNNKGSEFTDNIFSVSFSAKY